MEKYSSLGYTILRCFLYLTLVQCQNPNVTVSLDGTGNFSSIGTAILSAPNNSLFSYSIHVKEGVYFENVYVGLEKTNIIIYGDGMNKTIISSNKSHTAGIGTQDSATLDISASNFLVKDMSIVNSAGTNGEQAVALRTAGENISCYRCSIEGHQDTLFAVDGRHFFYECNIYGTIDFIFGDAAVVIQNCFIYVRRPREGQENVITASGRKIENSNGIVIHNCTITAATEFKPYILTVKTYLGRPWKEYSRTVIMESYLDDLIDDEGWLENKGSYALRTLYYAEYANRGPKSSTERRVKWPGYHVINNAKEVQNFTVENFIRGSDWLPQLGVPFIPGLIG